MTVDITLALTKDEMQETEQTRLYLNVPFSEKDGAKKLGAQWDAILKKWWVSPHAVDVRPALRRWLGGIDTVAKSAKAAPRFLESKPRSKRPVIPS